MRKQVSMFAVVLCLAVAVARGALGQDAAFKEGLSAYNAGEFERAAKLWAPLAEAGNANAQSGLGLLYYSGFGVRRDFNLARDLFLKAASQGVVQSQMFLSLMYFRGDGVRRDYKIAYMWSDNAVAAGYDEALEFRAIVTQHLRPEEVQEAARLASEWRVQHEHP